MSNIAVVLTMVTKSILKNLETKTLASQHGHQKLKHPVTEICRKLEFVEFDEDNNVDWSEKVRKAVYEADDLVDEALAATHISKGCNVFSIGSCKGKGPKIKRICKKLTQLAQATRISKECNVDFDFDVDVEVETPLAKLMAGYTKDVDSEMEKLEENIRKHLTHTNNLTKDISILSIVGDGGVGKTTLVQSIFKDISYSSLPPPLRACLVYLSLFPKDFKFNFLDVVSLWQAQGFLETATPHLDEDPEDLAKQYIMMLVARAFIIDLTIDEYGNISTFKMRNPEELEQAQGHKLRTFNCIASEDSIIGMKDTMILSKFKSLRVLDLHAFHDLVLPYSLGNLIHLRYLDLSRNYNLLKVPDSITNLHNLRTLKLNSCCNLKELPTKMRKLTCLRRLEIDGCNKLTFMPPGFESLSSIRYLSRYVVGKPRFRSASGFNSLGNLNDLQGRLTIELSKNWSSAVNEVTKSILRKKIGLTELIILWGLMSFTSKNESLQQQLLLDELQPPLYLKKLHIEGYWGPYFPRWARGNAVATTLPNLVTVRIGGCGECTTLPHFSRLQFLKHLTLQCMSKVEYFENSDDRSSALKSHFFPCLEELTLTGFYALKRWLKNETQESSLSFHKLKKLNIWSSPNLLSMPLFPNVEVLLLHNFNKKLLEFPNAGMIHQSSSCHLEIPNFGLQHLKMLHINSCPDFETLALGKNSTKLQKLVVENMDMMNSLREGLKQLTSLEELEVAGCKNIDFLGGCQGNCGECDECDAPWKCLSNLHRLTLSNLPKLTTLPIGLRFIETLKFLSISECTRLNSLPACIRNLTSLQHLTLKRCPNLAMLPEELKGLHSLVKVDIISCPKLTKRCNKGGEDWHKIKHARVLCH